MDNEFICPVEVNCGEEPAFEAVSTMDGDAVYRLEKFANIHVKKLRLAVTILSAILSVSAFLTGFILTALVCFCVFYSCVMHYITSKKRAYKFAEAASKTVKFSFYGNFMIYCTEISATRINYSEFKAVYGTDYGFVFLLPTGKSLLLKKECCGKFKSELTAMLKDRLKEKYTAK